MFFAVLWLMLRIEFFRFLNFCPYFVTWFCVICVLASTKIAVSLLLLLMELCRLPIRSKLSYPFPLCVCVYQCVGINASISICVCVSLCQSWIFSWTFTSGYMIVLLYNYTFAWLLPPGWILGGNAFLSLYKQNSNSHFRLGSQSSDDRQSKRRRQPSDFSVKT